MTGLREAVDGATTQLREAGVPSARADAVTLLAHVLRVPAAELQRQLVLGGDLDPDTLTRYDDLVAHRRSRVPLQHLTGTAPFRHLELAVGPGVFVPRPETELLVDLVLRAAHGLASPTVVDLCTGSGAIALAVKQELPAAAVSAVELDPMAHAWAARNRDNLGLDVEIACGAAQSAFPDLDEGVDVVVSNPPYIPVGMVPIDPEVRDHDPEVALYGGSEDGLRIPLAVASRAAELLRPGGVLIMEHADSQGDSLPAALRQQGMWVEVADHVDLTERPRAVTAVRRS
ncbi:peptide chain release factor N(5)-glutamine methyltransferase [Flexivirga sp. ID2601S]|uniref:Release factor glutamine methyltransferase n=1 Tax=Flexivirga aerilata TaxID=1656889 RepID=A0A849AEK7_9MICO|nr:peptide chain release factor N(5)-glutamine methyltransferase [Flexivirga aerilata]NNG39294.1 peptide chain release factor N(5)-glutamine methyltransferase [Flexivirga aerilata]